MSNDQLNYSDEMLNAYLDNELASEERKRLIEDLRENDGLRQRVCKLEQVRNMISIAYHDIPAPKHTLDPKGRSRSSFATIAASILVVVGIIGGWFGHAYLQQKNSGLVQLADSVQVNDPVEGVRPWKVLLHVTSDDEYRLNALLDETEKVLREYKARQQKVSVQILANGKGLNLLRDDKSPYGKRIAELQSNYDNLIFMACAKAMARVKQQTGKDVQLLPGIQVAPSALGEVLSKQKEGWTYIKI
jgi:intracellular sulfur oxidation DsrE/DsrF family protein